MKKYIVTLTAFAALSVGMVGQAFASSIHTVEKGETLWSISQQENVSIQELQAWNNLDSSVIYPSQALKVEEVSTSKTHIVVSGDTLFSIAQKYNLSVDGLMNSNQLTSDLIHPGDELVLEGTKVAVAGVSTTSPASSKVSNTASTPATTESTTQEMTVTATAYTAYCEGCSGVTSTGIDLISNPNQKVIAVDPTVIPLGSRVWVEGYGEAIAGDIGGAIKGNKIDVFIPSTQDALNWGSKTVTIKVLN
ncbi:3D (Asp-Asp-Asp) domain-containing protein [Psychrobacillus insolitus]|uniref:3D (Asp-Asp-Asp) domain-containing protein n=1 Tax=Psychrobacillus insolitus TaxID=1461 RepID=A0A2W7MGH0_9BACI|nr:3D domain-containing protein [Psychrobacillus insolitus]PZX05628.1 3D (Asp-Asp-Asp) domain-containing protein [Psychrobacillus insolitus]